MAANLQVVLGASGGTGRALVEELHKGGHPVRAVSRHPAADFPAGVEAVGADITHPEEARRVTDGAAVVFHAAQPAYDRWLKEFPAMTATIADATAAVGARLVLADNLYMYGPGSSPMTESTVHGANDRKGRLRSAMANDLLERHRRGELKVAIGRSSDYFGPWGVGTALGDRIFAAAVAGKPARWLGRLDVPHSTSFLPDLARALAIIGNRRESLGRVWHLPMMPAMAGQEFLEAVVDETGKGSVIRVDSPLAIRLAGIFVPRIREVAGIMYQYTEPFVADWSAFETVFGPFGPTSFGEAIRTTSAWWRARADGGRGNVA